MRRMRRLSLLTVGCCVALVAILSPRVGAQILSDPTLQLQTVVSSGLSQPTTMGFVGANDILVLQKGDGQVKRVVSGVVAPSPVLDVPVNNASERGLLGIAVNTENPPRVFLYYTEAATDGGTAIANRVYRFTWNAGAAALQSPQLVLDLPVLSGPNHNGGIVLLGPTPAPGPGQVGDGSLLHVVIGDLNRDGQLQNFPGGPAPDDTGVIFRVQQDGSAAPGNPFVPYCSVTTSQTCPTGTGCPGGETCRTQVARYYAYGVRNSFGMAIDPANGRLWDTENGPGNYDEVNLVAAGFNSGWEQIMGPDSRDAQGLGDLFNMPGGAGVYSDPEFSWQATIAPTAIVFPLGSALGAAYDNMVLVGDNNTGQIYRLPLNAARDAFNLSGFAGVADLVADSAAERDQFSIGSGFGVITDMKVGPDGALYVVSLSNGDIYRIAAATAATSTPTRTSTRTPTATSTATRTPTATATRTNTAVPPPTATRTGTIPPPPTSTATAAPTSTRTSTPTPTATGTAPATSTSTATVTTVATSTRTSTAISTNTRTATATAIATSTSTVSGTPTATRTATVAASVTPTQPAAAACAPAPLICRTPAVPGSAKLLLKNNGNPEKHLLLWKWLKGAETTLAEFGDPLSTDTYTLCVYDGGGLLTSATAPAGSICAGGACWQAKSTGFKYADKEAANDGLRLILLKEGRDGRAKILVRAKGASLPLPDLGGIVSPLTVQLTRSGSSLCWGAVYGFPPALRNDAEVFKDMAD